MINSVYLKDLDEFRFLDAENYLMLSPKELKDKA